MSKDRFAKTAATAPAKRYNVLKRHYSRKIVNKTFGQFAKKW